MPVRPTDAEIRNYLSYLNETSVDAGEWWRSVQPEFLQHVFRPIDIKETFPRSDAFGAGPVVTTNLSANIAQPTPISPGVGIAPERMLIVRGFNVISVGAAPDQVRISILNQAVGIDRLLCRTVSVNGVGFDDVFTQVCFALLPIVLYPGHSLRVEYVIAPAASMEITGTFYGEECDFPYRNFGT